MNARLTLAVLAAVLVAAPAHAATVSGEGLTSVLYVTDEVGEHNELVLDVVEGRLRITDAAADLQDDAEGCDLTAPRQMLCTGVPKSIFVTGGEADDALDLSGSPVSAFVEGGDGNDTIIGTAKDDTINEGPGADAIDGGPGADIVQYVFGTTGVIVDLTQAGGQPQPGGNDVLSRIENVTGGPGDDVLIGDDGANVLVGGPGRDRIRGAGGDDDLDGDGVLSITDPDDYLAGGDDIRGGRGDDRIHAGADSVADGGPGDDEVSAFRSDARGGPGADTVFASYARSVCGSGNDRVTVGFPRTFVTAACERIDPFHDESLILHRLRQRAPRLLVLPVSCAGTECTGTVTVLQSGTAIARGRYDLRPRGRARVRLPMARALRTGPVRVRLSFPRFVYDTRP